MCTACYCWRQLLCLEMENRLPPLSLALSLSEKGYPDKKVEQMRVGRGTRGDTTHGKKISFPALYGENSISWENLAERWQISSSEH